MKGWTCSTDGRDEMHKIFLFENLKERHHLEDLRVDATITLERILGTQGRKV
jgi:hypothetical protein